jgi:pilus assembly protein TadC
MQTPPPTETRSRQYRRNEKSEKGEKREKEEKGEKGEKQGYGFLGPLIGGLILIFLGVTFWLELAGVISGAYVWSFFLLLVGIVIIIAALYTAFVLSKRHPRP